MAARGLRLLGRNCLSRGEVGGGGYPVVADWRRCGVILLTDADSVCVCVCQHTLIALMPLLLLLLLLGSRASELG